MQPAIAEATHPYLDTRPLLTQPAVAEATRYNRETPPQGMAENSKTAEPGRASQQQGGASAGKQ